LTREKCEEREEASSQFLIIGARIPASRDAVAAKASPVPRDGVAKTSGASVRKGKGERSGSVGRDKKNRAVKLRRLTSVQNSVCVGQKRREVSASRR